MGPRIDSAQHFRLQAFAGKSRFTTLRGSSPIDSECNLFHSSSNRGWAISSAPSPAVSAYPMGGAYTRVRSSQQLAVSSDSDGSLPGYSTTHSTNSFTLWVFSPKDLFGDDSTIIAGSNTADNNSEILIAGPHHSAIFRPGPLPAGKTVMQPPQAGSESAFFMLGI